MASSSEQAAPFRGAQHARQSSDSEVVNRMMSSIGREKQQQKTAMDQAGSPSSPSGRFSIQERLLSKLLEQVIPVDESSPVIVDEAVRDVQTTKDLHMPTKPSFSLPIMSNNFRRFNARIGVVFVFQNKATHLLSWTYPTQTLSAACIFTFLVLHPVLIPMIPPLVTIFYILVPSFLSRHPPPPNPSLPSLASSLSGPPMAPPKTIAPAAEFSSDFLRNMRDLQNTMGDFSDGHDALVSLIAPATNFSDEARSSALFCVLVASCGLLSFAANLIPWRVLTLSIGWSVFAAGHPMVQQLIMEHYEAVLAPPTKRLRAGFRAWAAKDIVLDEQPEVAEVEVFELQRRVGGTFASITMYSPTSPGSSFTSASGGTGSTGSGSTGKNGGGIIEYEPWLFSPNSWEPRAPARVSGDRVKGARFFEDVAVPEGWEWKQKKWVLDLASKEWVEARMLGDVEVENEGERWVYDVEETADGRTKRGEWRRRRWIRLIQRKVYRRENGSGSNGSDAKGANGKGARRKS